jgi:hypothetical protein
VTIDEAFAEMKARGWGFSRNTQGFMAIGPILNPEYEAQGGYPIIEAIAIGLNPVQVLKSAIAERAKECVTCKKTGYLETQDEETGELKKAPCFLCQYRKKESQ